MSLAHLHLIMNHVPTVGSVVALALLILGYARRNEHLKHVGLELLFVIAVLTLPVYVSGVAAHRELREVKEVSDDAIRIHQDVALFGFAWMEFAGFIAWLALWQWRRRGAAELDGLAERLAAAVSAKPGTTMVVLASEVGASVQDLERPAKRLKVAGRIRSVGERNATRYFPVPPRKSAA